MVSLVNSFLALHLSIFSLRATILYPVTLASRSLSFLFCLLPLLVPGLPSFFLSLKISLHNLLGSVRSSFLVSSFVSFLLRVSFYDLPVVAYWFSVCLFLWSSHLFALYADRRSWWYLFCFLQEYLCGIFSLFLYPTCNLSIMVVRVSKNLMFVIFFLETPFHGLPGECFSFARIPSHGLPVSFIEQSMPQFSRTRQCYSTPISSSFIRFHFIVCLKMVVPVWFSLLLFVSFSVKIPFYCPRRDVCT